MMFTDIVGYSSMVGKDEKNALKLLAEHDSLIEPIINENNGSIIKKIGDAIFAEFPDSIKAAHASIDIQKTLFKRNELNRKKNLIQIRIGLHEGEVVEKDKDLFGNDVNLCSRIEGTSMPGGIAISSSVHNLIKDYSDIYVREIGYVELKNIKTPQQLYRLYIDKKEIDLESQSDLQKSLKTRGVKVVNIDEYEESKIISLAFMSLHNLGLKETEFTSHELTKSIASELNKIDNLSLPSFNDVINLKDSELTLSDKARQLRVDNLIIGTIGINNNDIDISLSMVDNNSGDQFWDRDFSGNINSFNRLKAQMISEILSEFDIEIPKAIQRSLSKELSQNSEACENYLKGKYILDTTQSPEKLEEAKSFFYNAFVIDKGFPEAYSQYGLCCNKLGNIEEGREYLLKGKEIAEHNKDDQSMAIAYNCMGISYINWHDPKEALENYEKALKIQISLEDRIEEAKINQNIAVVYNKMKHPDEGIKYLQKSIEILGEREPWVQGMCYANLGNCYLIEDRLSDAIINYEKALALFTQENMDNARGKLLVQLARSYICLGILADGGKLLTEAFEVCSIFNESIVMANLHWFSGKLLFNYKDTDKAIEEYNEAIALAQMAESFITTSEAMMELSFIYISINKLDKAKKEIQKCIVVLKKINNENQIKTCELFLHYFDICDKKINNLDVLDKHYKYGQDNTMDSYYWYILASSYLELDEKNKSSTCHTEAKHSITQLSQLLTNKGHMESFMTNNYFNSIIISNLEKIESETISKQSSVPAFCSNCGSPTGEAKFCSNCGNKLF